jgi:hypothetical protein
MIRTASGLSSPARWSPYRLHSSFQKAMDTEGAVAIARSHCPSSTKISQYFCIIPSWRYVSAAWQVARKAAGWERGVQGILAAAATHSEVRGNYASRPGQN